MSTRYLLCARSPSGRKLMLNKAGKLSTRGPFRHFSTLEDAGRVGRQAKERVPDLSGYTIFAEPVPPIRTNPRKKKKPVKRRNPSGFANARDAYLAEVDKAADDFERFTGFPATKEIRVKQAPIRTGFALGKLVSVTYEQTRSGMGLSHFRHDFKTSSRPLLVSANDGKTLAIVGGRFRIDADSGINDE